jgi:hypothetical protein
MTRGKVVTITRSAYFLSTVVLALSVAALLTATSPAFAVCSGPGTQTSQGGTPQTTCLTAIQIPGNPLRSFDLACVALSSASVSPVEGEDPVSDGHLLDHVR